MERVNAYPEAPIETLRAMLAGSLNMDAMSINVHRRRGLSIRVESGEVSEKHDVFSFGVGLRLVFKGTTAFASTTQMDGDGLRDLVADCLKKLSEAEPNLLGDIQSIKVPASGANFEKVDLHFLQISQDEKINRLINLEKAFLNADPKISEVERVTYRDLNTDDWLWTSGSDKILHHHSTSGFVSGVAVATRESHQSKGFGMSSESQYFDLDWSGVVKEATAQALKTLGGSPIAEGSFPVMIQSSAMAALWLKMSPVFFADRVLNGESFFQSGKKYENFSPALMVSDDPFLKKSIHTRLWDAEGTPTQRVPLIENGRLMGFCHSQLTAKKFEMAPTGSLVRENFFEIPRIGFHHLVVEPGRKDFVDLLRDLQEGLVIYKIKHFERVDLKTGDFRIHVAGTWVEKGEEVRPVDQIALAGNFLDALSKISAVGRDQNSHLSVSTPSILFGNLSISGA